MHYHPITDEDREQLLKTIGVHSVQDLLRGIPESLRNPVIELLPALSELEIQKDLRNRLVSGNSAEGKLSFLGAGSYDHFVPSAVAQLASRNEFYTAYTPYQPEASQGTLQAIFEYQSLITELTGMDVSNASHYDGATAMSEAALMALRHTDRKIILVSRAVHPQYRETLQTYLLGTPFKMKEITLEGEGTSLSDLRNQLTADVAGVILQTPNYLGTIENLTGLKEELASIGALLIIVANPLALAISKTPGEWGADIAVGEGQPLGIRPQFGGPYLGYIATTRALMRKIPGRLVGITQDAEGRRAYVLTLTAREQHIRRERASSNICTNQGLCALMACIFMTLLGKQGLPDLAELNRDRASYLRDQISRVPGFEISTEANIFNEFVVKSKKPAELILKSLESKGILGGVLLSADYPEYPSSFLVCATETKSKEDLDQYVEALRSC